MKKLTLLFLSILSSITFISCSNTQSKLTSENKPITQTELVYDTLSEKEEYFPLLTEDKILMYTLKDIPQNQKYKLSLIYEIYENEDKIKEEEIAVLTKDEFTTRDETHHIGVNLQKNKIRFTLSFYGGQYDGDYDIKEDLDKYTENHLAANTPFILGSEAYIYSATSSNKPSTTHLGSPIDLDALDKLLKENQSTVLIKLSFKEI